MWELVVATLFGFVGFLGGPVPPARRSPPGSSLLSLQIPEGIFHKVCPLWFGNLLGAFSFIFRALTTFLDLRFLKSNGLSEMQFT